MRILITGNSKTNITKSITEIYEDIHTVSRSVESNYTLDLTIPENINHLAKISCDYDIFINCSLIPDFGQTKILQAVWTEWKSNNKQGHIINFGSSVDYYYRPDNRLYPIEKRSLRDLNRSLSKHATWFDSKIKCTYFSFGGVSTEKTEKQWGHYSHFSCEEIASYVKWLIESPKNVNIDELHITPIQPKTKKEMKKSIKNDVNISWDSGDRRIYLINEE
jgi:short-subunit dehydrogenase